ncbi:unnamed protein product [Rhodiola kirilowii]
MSSTATDPQLFPAFISPSNHRHDASGTSWSFLQALADTTHSPNQENNAAVYVHPLVKKTSSKLSEKSLEMCTESLGSETGSDIMEANMIESSTKFDRKDSKIVGVAKTKREYNFPPPLTSISNSVNMKAHRENGRLVMDAVVVAEGSNFSLFDAERIDGRLMLWLKKRDEEDDDKTEESDETNGGEKTEDSASWDEDLNGNTKHVEGNIGNDENISRVGSRCNEGGGEKGEKGHLWNMETCWVAT